MVFFAGIGPGYAAARAIYVWMGWQERRREPFIESSTLPRDDGGSDTYVEAVTIWEKELDVSGTSAQNPASDTFHMPRPNVPANSSLADETSSMSSTGRFGSPFPSVRHVVPPSEVT